MCLLWQIPSQIQRRRRWSPGIAYLVGLYGACAVCPSGTRCIFSRPDRPCRLQYQLRRVTRAPLRSFAVPLYLCICVSLYLLTPVPLYSCLYLCTHVPFTPVCTSVRMYFCTLVPLRLYSCSFVPRYPFPCTVYLYPCPPVTLFPYSVSLYLFTSNSTPVPLYPCPAPRTSDRCALLSLTTDQ